MPAGSTYSTIATYTVPSAQTSYTFTSIPGTYTDLILIFNGGISATGNSLHLQFNGDTGTNYSTTDLWGNGSAASSGRTSSANFIRVNGRGIGADNTLTGNCINHIQNYSNTTTFKTLLNRSNETGGTSATVGLWRSTSAITSITLTAESALNILTGSTFTLYGISAA
jgi:hypothetical protein